MIYLSKSIKETEKIASMLTEKFISSKTKHAKIIALEGELGAGKTVFTKGLAKALGIKAKIKSPTFALMKKYSISSLKNFQFSQRFPASRENPRRKTSNFQFLYHLDCYRLKDHNDLKPLGIKEVLNNPENIVVIEWSDRVKKILPKKHIKIHIDHVDRKTRKIKIVF